MDISLLSKMIGELLLDHEEVGLPGLGAFLAEMVPASFSDKGFTINPPYKKVSFIPGFSEDDSLVSLYKESNGIEYDQAKDIISGFLEEVKRKLVAEKLVVFPGLGRLRSTRQNNFFFITDEDLDIFPDGFGLPQVSLKNHAETPSEVREKVEELVAFVEAPVPEADAPLAEADEPVAEVPMPRMPEELDVPLIEPAEPSEQPAEPSEQPAEPSEPAEQAEPAEPVKPVKPAKPARKTKPARHFPKWLKNTLITILFITVLAALALAVFVILVQVAPDFIDSILYTPEELSIINYQ